jgi:hypothetical protein
MAIKLALGHSARIVCTPDQPLDEPIVVQVDGQMEADVQPDGLSAVIYWIGNPPYADCNVTVTGKTGGRVLTAYFAFTQSGLATTLNAQVVSIT